MTTSRDGEVRELWSAVADPTRQLLVDALVEGGEATATKLAVELPISRQGVVKHLEVLERAGLVTRRRVGREVRFAVRPDALDEITQHMTQLADQWSARLQKVKRLAESVHRANGLPNR